MGVAPPFEVNCQEGINHYLPPGVYKATFRSDLAYPDIKQKVIERRWVSLRMENELAERGNRTWLTLPLSVAKRLPALSSQCHRLKVIKSLYNSLSAFYVKPSLGQLWKHKTGNTTRAGLLAGQGTYSYNFILSI